MLDLRRSQEQTLIVVNSLRSRFRAAPVVAPGAECSQVFGCRWDSGRHTASVFWLVTPYSLPIPHDVGACRR